MANEEWRPIPGFAGYEASSLGRIRSVDRVIRAPTRWGTLSDKRLRGRIIRPAPGSGGYRRFVAAGQVDVQVNRAVAIAFHGLPPSERHEAAHLDGDKTNNRPDNLVWATPRQNASHMLVHDTRLRGEKSPSTILRDADIPAIFGAYLEGESLTDIARAFGISRSAASRILRRESWTHVEIDAATIGIIESRRAQNIKQSWETAAARMTERGPTLLRAA